MKDKQVEFKGEISKCVYSSPNFKVYGVDVDILKYPDVKLNQYGNVSISGDISDLIVGSEYEITAIEENGKYGVGYKVVNIRRDIPASSEGAKIFLEEILTKNQADVLYEVYPDIINIVKENRCDEVDLSKLHGIGEATFGLIKSKIIENFKLADLVSEFKRAISLSMLKRIYDKYSDIDVLKAKLKEEPYSTLTRISGVGFKKADAIVLELQKKNIIDFEYDVETSNDRCLACIIYLLQENEKEGNTCMNLSDLRSQCLKMIPGCVKHFVNVVKDDAIYYNKDDMSVGLKSTYDNELYIAETIVSNIKTDDVWDYDIEKYRNVGEFELSDEQMNAVSNVCKYGVSILNGLAGSGKSFSTQAIINMLKDGGKTFILMAPTGKAAKIISEYTREKASTIHRGLGYNPKFGWSYNKDCKLPYNVVVVDEFSMCDVSLFKHLIDAIDFKCTRLLIVGDSGQLPSVGCGNLLHDFINSDIIPTTTLKNVFRYNEGGLSKVATDSRFCKPYLEKSMKNKITQFGKSKDYAFIDIDSKSIPKSVVSLYKKLMDNGNDKEGIQVLTPKNIGDCGTIALNSMIQKAVNSNYGKPRFMKVGEVVYYDDDLVIQIQNNYTAEMCDEKYSILLDESGEKATAFVANGETGLVKYACKDYVVIDFDGILVRYSKDMMNTVRHGYSISIHKSQGSSIKNVIICTPKSDAFLLNSNIIYTALTRMKEHCYHFGSVDTVNMAVKKKANLNRNTFIKQMLNNLSCKNKK